MARRRRTLVLLVLGLFLLALGLITVGYLPQDILRGYVEKQLQSALGPGSRLRRLHVVPGRLSAEFQDLVIEGPNYRLTAPRGRVVLTLDFLLGRSLSLKSVVLESPRLEMSPGPEDRPVQPVRKDVLIRQLQVSNGTILFHTEEQGAFLIEGLRAHGSIGLGPLQVSTTGGEWRRGESLDLGPAKGTLTISRALEVRIDALRAEVEDSLLEISGTLGRAGALRPDVQVTADVDLDDLRAFGAPAMEGRIEAKGRLRQDGDELVVDGEAGGRDLDIAGWPVARARAEVERRGARTRASFDASLLGGRARGRATLEGEDVEADVRADGIALAALRRQGVDLGIALDGTVGGRVQGKGTRERLRVDADLVARGTAEGRRVTARLDGRGVVGVAARTVDLRYTLALDAAGATGPATLRVGDVRATVRGTARGALPPVVEGAFDGTAGLTTAGGSETVPLSGRFRSARGVTTFEARLRALGGAVQAEGSYGRGRFERLAAHGEGVQLARVRPEAGGTLTFDLTAAGAPSALTGEARAEVADLLWNGAWLGPVTARASGTAGRGRLSFAAPELRAEGAGTFDRERLQLTARVDQAPLDLVGDALQLQDPLGGEATGTVDVSLPFANPAAATVVARLDSAEVQTPRLEARITQPFLARLQGRRFSVEGLSAEGEGFAVQLTASAGLDPDAPIDGRARFDLDLARLPARAGWVLTGRAAGDVALSGSRRRPRAHGGVDVADVLVRNEEKTILSLAAGRVDLAGEAATTTGLRAEVPGGFLELTGRVPLAELLPEPTARALGLAPTGPIEAQLRFDVDLARIVVRPPWVMTGRAEGDLTLVGPRARPRTWGAITLTEVSATHPFAPPIVVADARIEMDGDAAVIPGIRASVGGGVVDLEGRVPLAAVLTPAGAERVGLISGVEADLVARWEGVQLAAVLEAVRPDRPARVTAALAGEARLMGTLVSWREAHGDLRLVPTAVRAQDLDVEVTPVVARLASGRVAIDDVEVRARGGVFHAGGTADLFARTLDLAGRGTLDLRTVSPFLEEAVLTGSATVDLTLAGAFDAPRPSGSVQVRDATLRLRDIRQPLTAMSGQVTIDEGQVRLSDVTAQFGGGPVRMEGTGRVAGIGLTDVRVAISGEGLGLRYPVARAGRAEELFEELKARVDVDLTLTGRTGDLMLAGTVRAERSLYDADIFLEEGLLPPDVPEAGHHHSPLLHSIGLDITIVTVNPFLVRNNLAQAEAEGTLSLRGSMDEPAPFGRFDIRSGGKVFLQEREFTVQSGMLTFTGTTDPEIAITASTVIPQPEGDYEVTIVARGMLLTPQLSLRSNPALSEREIASLIATGRTDVALNTGAWLVGEQATALLAGRFTRRVARELMDLGLDQVDIQPELLAREGDPSARFTFGKQLGRSLRLVYSASLSDPEAQYYQALFRFRPGMELSAKLQRRFDGTFTYSLGQRLRFGGTGAPPRETREVERVELAAVRLEGDLREFPTLLEAVDARAGKKVTYWDLLDDVDRIRERLVGLGHLEAVLDARLDGSTAIFGGQAGARYRWRVEGMTEPPDLAREITGSLFEEEAVDRGRRRLLEDLRRHGHLRAGVEVASVAENGWRTLVFTAEPGPVLTADVRFPGAALLSPAALTEAAGGAAVLLTRPRDAERGIRAAYREKNRLAARVGPVQTADSDGLVRIVVPVDEGPAARVASIAYPGSTLLRETLDVLTGIPIGSAYDPLVVSEAVLRLRDQYLRKGFPAIRVLPRVEPAGTDLALRFHVTEGPRLLVGDVEIVGLRRTRRSLVERQVDLPRGEPLDPRKLATMERRLLDLGIFRRVSITHGPASPATVRIELEEDAPYLAAYDLRYNVEEGGTALVDAERRNLLGLGVAVGARVRIGRGLQEYRGSLSAPSFLWGGGDITLSAHTLSDFVRTLREVPPTLVPPRSAEGHRRELGLQLQQALHVLHPWEFLYGYRFKRTTCPGQGFPPLSRNRNRRLYDPCETPLVRVGGDLALAPQRRIDVAGIDLTAVHDQRDNPLNPTRGRFMSLNVLLAPQFLLSDFDFLKEFGQVSLVRGLGRSPLVWAQGYRVGLIQTLGGQRLPYDDLFKAGGPNSVRGFSIDSLGPRGPRREALGGEAVIVVNQELRYVHEVTGLGAAVFYDAGNVFAKVREVDLDLMHSAGVGVRYESPVGMLRLDLAFPLNRRPGDRAYQLNFGLGQAF